MRRQAKKLVASNDFSSTSGANTLISTVAKLRQGSDEKKGGLARTVAFRMIQVSSLLLGQRYL